MNARGLALVVAVALAAPGCAQQLTENRVRAALLDAGLSPRNADCMARRMVDRLSISQLRKLEALRGEKRSLVDYVEAVERIGDSEVIAVTATSAALCATGLAR